MEFKVLKMKDNEYKYLIIMLSERNPYELLNKIVNRLKKMGNGHGRVIFDLTLCNLDKETRYIEAYFDGDSLDPWQFHIVKKVPATVKNKSFEFLSKNYSKYVENSILTSAEKFKYRKGIRT